MRFLTGTLLSGTLTKNEQTVTELYTVDEVVAVDPSASSSSSVASPALRKTMEIGAICNNASSERRENGKYVGQSTDVALLEVLDVFGLEDARRVSFLPFVKQQLHTDNLTDYRRTSTDYQKSHSILRTNTWPSVAFTLHLHHRYLASR